MKIEELLEARHKARLCWVENRSAAGPEGNELSSFVGCLATVHDCINIHRRKLMDLDGVLPAVGDSDLLEAFMNTRRAKVANWPLYSGKTFGEALEALKAGGRIAREGWNGKSMFLFLLPAGIVPRSAIHNQALRQVVDKELGEGATFEALGSVRMFTADKKILTGWNASQPDLLSSDWCILQDDEQPG